MPVFEHETILAAPLSQVWAFHDQIEQGLATLTPPEMELAFESVGPLPPQVGTEVVLRAKSPIGRKRWVARYVEYVPPHAVVFGQEARFVDEQVSGPFKRWQHAHEFEAVDDRTTRLFDRITYSVGFGPLGWIADPLLVRPTLKRLFRYRTEQLKSRFG